MPALFVDVWRDGSECLKVALILLQILLALGVLGGGMGDVLILDRRGGVGEERHVLLEEGVGLGGARAGLALLVEGLEDKVVVRSAHMK